MSKNPAHEAKVRKKLLDVAKNNITDSGFDDELKKAIVKQTISWEPVKWELNRLIESGHVERDKEAQVLYVLNVILENYKKSKQTKGLEVELSFESIETDKAKGLKRAISSAKKLKVSLDSVDWLIVKSISPLYKELNNFIVDNSRPKGKGGHPGNTGADILFKSFEMVWINYTKNAEITKDGIPLAFAFIDVAGYPGYSQQTTSVSNLLKRFRVARKVTNLPFLIGSFKGIN